MIRSKVLGQVQFICQNFRSSSDLFGNLQVILAVDFLQLPPVANELVGDRGLHCFNVPWFNRCFPCNYLYPRQYFWKKDEHNFPHFQETLTRN
jgi:hypothetical protein